MSKSDLAETIKILSRELLTGTFNKTCSADECQTLRTFVYNLTEELKSEYKDFGMANGWFGTPLLVETCTEKKHFIKEKNIGRCLTEFKCDICKYKYQVDSSD